MSDITFAELVKQVHPDTVLLPWQEQFLKALEGRKYVAPGIHARNMKWEFQWLMQLMQMRALWIDGKQTTAISPHFESVNRPVIILDEYEQLLKGRDEQWFKENYLNPFK